ncbi:MAG: hypothetical protein GY925_06280 [Actinomycetia bacterium]|nr:hypothetical protein [Actinomycetes bacterium]
MTTPETVLALDGVSPHSNRRVRLRVTLPNWMNPRDAQLTIVELDAHPTDAYQTDDARVLTETGWEFVDPAVEPAGVPVSMSIVDAIQSVRSAEVEALRATLNQVKEDRDRWQALAEASADTLREVRLATAEAEARQARPEPG